jgi:hypothetical protein
LQSVATESIGERIEDLVLIRLTPLLFWGGDSVWMAEIGAIGFLLFLIDRVHNVKKKKLKRCFKLNILYMNCIIG